jgi:hypothetical protein
MKNIVIGIIIAAVFIGGLFAVLFLWTGNMVDVADAFFADIQAGDEGYAYDNYTSQGFKTNVSIDQFNSLLEGTQIGECKNASWPNREIKNNTGFIKGSIRTDRGEELPMKIDFIKEEGEWKIHHIGFDPVIPKDETIYKLVNNQVLLLDKAVKKQDFKEIYNKSASGFRQGGSPGKFQKAFHAFIDKKIDLSIIKDKNPVFDEKPKLLQKGVFSVSGHYETEPAVYFNFIFIFEDVYWKMVKINVKLS